MGTTEASRRQKNPHYVTEILQILQMKYFQHLKLGTPPASLLTALIYMVC